MENTKYFEIGKKKGKGGAIFSLQDKPHFGLSPPSLGGIVFFNLEYFTFINTQKFLKETFFVDFVNINTQNL